jgi:hypothetical protein
VRINANWEIGQEEATPAATTTATAKLFTARDAKDAEENKEQVIGNSRGKKQKTKTI